MSEVWIVETGFYIIFEVNIKNMYISLYMCVYIYIARACARERETELTVIIDKERIPILFF